MSSTLNRLISSARYQKLKMLYSLFSAKALSRPLARDSTSGMREHSISITFSILSNYPVPPNRVSRGLMLYPLSRDKSLTCSSLAYIFHTLCLMTGSTACIKHPVTKCHITDILCTEITGRPSCKATVDPPIGAVRPALDIATSVQPSG